MIPTKVTTETRVSPNDHPFLVSRDNVRDNSPWTAPDSFSYQGEALYYFLDDPSESMLFKVARSTPLGWRLTYGLAQDVYINEFQLEFPDLPTISDQEAGKKASIINAEIYQHLLDIHYFEEMKKACAYDYEQGESLLLIYREGDGITPEEVNLASEDFRKDRPERVADFKFGDEIKNPQLLKTLPIINKDGLMYSSMSLPPDLSKPIVRVEAINRVDYTIDAIGTFGKPSYYKIIFWADPNQRPTYVIHPDRCIRIKSRNINYDQYKGQSILKACFGHLSILATIDKMAGQAAYRWAFGIPIIPVKGMYSEERRNAVKTMFGNIASAKWLLVPEDMVDTANIKMLGQSGEMLDLPRLADMIINQVAAMAQIPKPILMGEQAGVISGSEVNQREYFATLDREHSMQNVFHRQFFNLDPFIHSRLKGIKYNINWGLRQVMSEMEKMEYQSRKYLNAINLQQFIGLNEVRKYAEFEPFENTLDAEEKKWMEWAYGIPVRLLVKIPPSLGQWRQRALQEIIQTPPERAAAEAAKEEAQLMGRNEVNQTIERATPTQGKTPAEYRGNELNRIEGKMERSASGGYSGRDLTIQTEVIEKQQKDLKTQALTIDQLKNEIAQLRKQFSIKEIASQVGVAEATMSKMVSYLEGRKNDVH